MTKKSTQREALENDLTATPSREAIRRLRGSLKGFGLPKALIEARAEDLRREEVKLDRFRQKDRL